jgi:hypothetical protein
MMLPTAMKRTACLNVKRVHSIMQGFGYFYLIELTRYMLLYETKFIAAACTRVNVGDKNSTYISSTARPTGYAAIPFSPSY